MHVAVRDGDATRLGTLLCLPESDPNASFEDGVTLLHMAVMRGDVPCATALLAHASINPNKADMFGRTPLHAVAFRDARKETVTTFRSAREVDYTACVAMLLAHPAIEPDKLDASGRSPLHDAVYPYAAYSKMGSLEMLLNHPAVDANRPLPGSAFTIEELSPIEYVIKSLSRHIMSSKQPMATIFTTLLQHEKVNISGLQEYSKRVFREGRWRNGSFEEVLEAIGAEDCWRRRRCWIRQCVY